MLSKFSTSGEGVRSLQCVSPFASSLMIARYIQADGSSWTVIAFIGYVLIEQCYLMDNIISTNGYHVCCKRDNMNMFVILEPSVDFLVNVSESGKCLNFHFLVSSLHPLSSGIFFSCRISSISIAVIQTAVVCPSPLICT